MYKFTAQCSVFTVRIKRKLVYDIWENSFIVVCCAHSLIPPNTSLLRCVVPENMQPRYTNLAVPSIIIRRQKMYSLTHTLQLFISLNMK